jgi:hypothetical protein
MEGVNALGVGGGGGWRVECAGMNRRKGASHNDRVPVGQPLLLPAGLQYQVTFFYPSCLLTE